jgi:hypothetical protein
MSGEKYIGLDVHQATISVAVEVCMLITRERYLHFDNLDMSLPFISSNCSQCGREFNEVPVSREQIDLVLMRIRARFDAHECIPREAPASGMRIQ